MKLMVLRSLIFMDLGFPARSIHGGCKPFQIPESSCSSQTKLSVQILVPERRGRDLTCNVTSPCKAFDDEIGILFMGINTKNTLNVKQAFMACLLRSRKGWRARQPQTMPAQPRCKPTGNLSSRRRVAALLRKICSGDAKLVLLSSVKLTY